ncbi:MAG: hypothetical protein RIS35_1472 [Pseudomonadota bacterium]
MPDRLAEIRARLDAARNEERIQRERTDKGVGWNPPCGCGEAECGTWDEWYPVKHHEGDLYENAAADIAWLLDEVERQSRYRERWYHTYMALCMQEGVSLRDTKYRELHGDA